MDTVSFIAFFYFLYYDNSHFEKQSFIKQGLLETIKEINIEMNIHYAVQLSLYSFPNSISYLRRQSPENVL